MSTPKTTQTTIAIIGGGVSGALVALHVAQLRVQARVIVIDPRPEIGLGLAYSTPTLRHLLNVPAGKISALPDQPTHFLDWLRGNYDADATPMTFAPRAIFGGYIRSLFTKATQVEQMQASVLDLHQRQNQMRLTLDDGSELVADLVVLATGNFDPAELRGVSETAQVSGLYRHNAWLSDTYEGLASDSPVTLIGTGLTGVDVLLRLREIGHRGPITAVSRHGIFPNPHAAYTAMDRSAIPAGTKPTCMAYLRTLRDVIRAGTPWRAAIDSLRATTNDLWLALPLKEQQRFRRHLQRHWDVVRHRMAPHIAAVIEREFAQGTLIIREGHLQSVESADKGATVIIRTPQGNVSFHTARVINCTGPSMNYRQVQSPLLKSLFAQGLVSSGPMGGGFHCTRSGALIGANGKPSQILFNLGPGRLGTLLESIAIPEIRQQAVELAAILAQIVQQRHVERSPSIQQRAVVPVTLISA